MNLITGLDHANIYTSKIEETEAFFVNVLGLKVGYRPDFPIPGRWLYAGDQGCVHICGTDEQRTGRGPIDHFSLVVADFEALLKHLDKLSVPYRTFVHPDGSGRQCFISDPNGVNIELLWHAPAGQPYFETDKKVKQPA